MKFKKIISAVISAAMCFSMFAFNASANELETELTPVIGQAQVAAVSVSQLVNSTETIVTVNGEQRTIEDITYDEVKELYKTELGVDYETLVSTTSDITYIRGVLQVTDAENYTEGDIYNCLFELLTQYETEID